MVRDVRGVVNKLVKKYGTRDPFRLADELGVVVQYFNLEGLHGFYTYERRQRIILLNSQLRNSEENRQLKTVMAHELGHAVLHKENQCYFFPDSLKHFKSKIELEANFFASELLISDEDILEHQSFTAEQLAKVTGYEKRLVELRMKNYDIHSARGIDINNLKKRGNL